MQRDVLAEFAHLRDVAMLVADLIAEVRTYMTTFNSETEGQVEIEARLGRVTPTHFDPNVGHGTFCGILSLLESYPRWSRVAPWQETQDVFYSAELPKEYGGESDKSLPIRTSVGVGSEGDIEIVHYMKRRIRNVDMELCHLDGESCCMNVTRKIKTDGLDVRVAASMERMIPHHLLPIAVSPDMVRIKQRKRFFLPSLGIEGEAFSFDLSIVYCGKTKSDAEQKQSNQLSPSFEVEVECLQPTEYLKTSGGEDIMLALSLILKCHDFSSALADTSVTYKPALQTRNLREMKVECATDRDDSNPVE